VTTMDDLSVLYTAAVYMGYHEFWALTDRQLADMQKLLVDKLLPNIRKFSSTFSDQANLFANKEVDLAWGWTGVIEKSMQEINVDFVTEHQITPAMPWYVDAISAVADTKNPGGVGNWINYNLDPKVSAQRFESNGLPTVVPKAVDFLSPQDQQLSYLTPDTSSLWTNLDQKLQWRPVDRRSLYQQVWNSVKSGIREFSK
jgi:spermidine/putrescine-binding protein